MVNNRRRKRGRYNSKLNEIHIFEKPLFAKYFMFVCIGLDSYKKIQNFVKNYWGFKLKPSNMSPFIRILAGERKDEDGNKINDIQFIKLKHNSLKGKKGYTKGFEVNWDIIIERFFKAIHKDIEKKLGQYHKKLEYIKKIKK